MARNTTIQRRLEAAGARQQSALGLFEKAAADLNAAAEEHLKIATDAAVKAADLQALHDQAKRRAVSAAASAKKIGELIGGHE